MMHTSEITPQAVAGAAVSFSHVSKTFGTYVAVDDFNLEILPGEFVSLLGPSGSGKSTTLMMLAGFQTPSSGRIFLGGRDITLLPPYRRDIGMVYQNYALFPHMTVAQNVGFPLRMRKVPKARMAEMVREALAMVRLEAFAQRMPHQLSGGQQQRVAIARALVFQPPLVLMDEPLGALDKNLREELQIEIKRIQRLTRSTILYVTHDQDEALSMSDRVVVMNHARIEHAGTPEEVYNRPRTGFTASFLGSANSFRGSVTEKGGQRLLRGTSGLEFPVSGIEPQDPADVTLILRPECVRVHTHAAPAHSFPGRVVTHAYHGHSDWMLIRLQSGDEIIATRAMRGVDPVEEGQPVNLSWEAHSLHALAPVSIEGKPRA